MRVELRRRDGECRGGEVAAAARVEGQLGPERSVGKSIDIRVARIVRQGKDERLQIGQRIAKVDHGEALRVHELRADVKSASDALGRKHKCPLTCSMFLLSKKTA